MVIRCFAVLFFLFHLSSPYLIADKTKCDPGYVSLTSFSNNSLLGPFSADKWVGDLADKRPSKFYEAASDLKTHFARTLVSNLAARAGTGAKKAAAYEKAAQEINRRLSKTEQLARRTLTGGKPSDFDIPAWRTRRVELGGNIILFYSDQGRVVEFHPNGDIYRADTVFEQGNDPRTAEWKPPYDSSGNPIESKIRPGSRRKL